MTDPTPEERAEKLWAPFGTRPTIAKAIREAETVASAKAFSDSAAICDRLAAKARTDAQSARGLGFFEQAIRHDREERAHMDAAEKIRSRAKEA